MKTENIAWIVVAVVVLIGGGWYFMSGTGEPTTTLGTQDSTGQTNTGQQNVAPVLTVVNDATLGDYLV
ncbi:MAG: hypothetical protein Q7S05_02725, partial [bacterium]|nr:hypothetical protein [bacterium]